MVLSRRIAQAVDRMVGVVVVFLIVGLFFQVRWVRAEEPVLLDPEDQRRLCLPIVSTGEPEAGKRVAVTPPEYRGTNVHHMLYLPDTWDRDRRAKLPVIFEYTGNSFPQSGSTGRVADAGLGFGLSGGKYIWVTLPFVGEEGTTNAVRWWGDEEATIRYAKVHVPRIIAEFRGDPDAVFLCGFSRGAIATSYIGLHDSEIAELWTAFITHDHFDGVKEWSGTEWGGSLFEYRQSARERLRRVAGRPYLISDRNVVPTEAYVKSIFRQTTNFTFLSVDMNNLFGQFPNSIAVAPHTDRWLLLPSPYRAAAWRWMNEVVKSGRTE